MEIHSCDPQVFHIHGPNCTYNQLDYLQQIQYQMEDKNDLKDPLIIEPSISLHHLPESYLPYLWDEEWDLGINCNLILLLVQRYSKTAENIFSSVFQV